MTKKEKEIRASLEKQLKDCGADLLHYQELLDDYIFFFGMERKMQAAVKKQGLTVTAVSAAGKEYDKEKSHSDNFTDTFSCRAIYNSI